MLKLKKKTLQGTKTHHALHSEQIHGNFSLSLNQCRDLNPLNFISRLFHKAISLILMNLFHISECLSLELRGKYPFSMNIGYFTPDMFST